MRLLGVFKKYGTVSKRYDTENLYWRLLYYQYNIICDNGTKIKIKTMISCFCDNY